MKEGKILTKNIKGVNAQSIKTRGALALAGGHESDGLNDRNIYAKDVHACECVCAVCVCVCVCV